MNSLASPNNLSPTKSLFEASRVRRSAHVETRQRRRVEGGIVMMLMSRNATPAEKVRRHVALSAGVTALGGLLFGYDTGVVSGALLFVKKDFGGLSSFQEELITSLLLVGAVVGALLAGRVADLIGRRLTVLITAAIFVVGVLLAAFTPTYPVLLVARVIIGLAVGSASMVVPLYIGALA